MQNSAGTELGKLENAGNEKNAKSLKTIDCHSTRKVTKCLLQIGHETDGYIHSTLARTGAVQATRCNKLH